MTLDEVRAAAEAMRTLDPRAPVLARTSTMSAEDVSRVLSLAYVTLQVSPLAEGLPLSTRCEWISRLGGVLLVTPAEFAAIRAAVP